jgi:hypothetical protein
MGKLKRAGKSGAIDVAESQPVAKNQLAVLVDIVRQLVGNPNIASGSTESTDPLTAPFHLYIDDLLGRDTFVTGDFNSFESTGTDEERIAQKLKRIREQRLECGYTRSSPFKTLNRAALEAYVITSLNWYTFTDARAHRDCVIIHMASGPQFIYNHPGSHSSAVAVSAWGDGKVPTWQELIAFNDNNVGGVILPRGAAFDGEDLRKCVLVPMWAPTPADTASDYSNVRCVLYLTPDIHAVDFTFRDPIGQNQSLHLLYGLGYPSQAQLNQFYGKAYTALGSGANLSAALSAARATEYQVVGPFTGTPTPAWDTVQGASAYPERISLRSEWGMGGLFINGDNLGGLKSTVTAQFTGVSLQKDISSLQIYSGGSWITPSTHQAYIDTAPDNRRVKPERAHCHLLVIRDAFCSEVSVFGVGHTARARADLGGEIVSSNGNFTFGSCAALATGYGRAAVSLDRGWLIDRISVPLNPSEKTPAIRRITLGVVASHTASGITLLQPLASDSTGTTPQLLAQDGYSLPSGTYIWVENPEGDDWRAQLTGTAWASGAPNQLNISAALSQSGTNAAVPSSSGVSNAVGKSAYIRRVVDSRTLAERSASLELVTSTGSRTPNRSAILQTSPGVSGGGIARTLVADGEEVVAVTSTVKTSTGARVTLRRSCPSVNYTVGTFYRKGVTVKSLNKHYKAIRSNYATTSTPSMADWDEAYVHMPEAYNPEEPITNEAPQVVFDTDTDPNDITTSCGINWTTVFNNSGPIRDQYRTGADVLGTYALLRALGFTDSAAWAVLAPRSSAARRLDPASATDFPTAPSGGAASGRARWAIEFRRPTTITLSNFTYDQGAGHGNYSTALPAAQKSMSASNLFSLYYTNGGGGRVVVNGVNENGQTVTNRGLSDAETGETVLSGDVAGGENTSKEDSFSNISINGLTGFGAWNLSALASLIFPTSSASKTTSLGTVKLASAAALRSSNSISGATDTELDTNLNNTPEVVTLKGLNYWARNAGVLTRRTGVVTLYVVPDSATAAGQTFNFDGTSATLTLSPIRSTAGVFEAPPLTGATAVTLAVAVAYANAVFSPEETVKYQLANGPYWNSPAAFGHKVDVVGATARFPETNVVSSYTSANTKPTTDVKALHDARSPFLVPCFATGINVGIVIPGQSVGFSAFPFRVELTYGGTVRGVCWLTAAATLADTSNFPSDPIYSAALRSYRSSGVNLASFIDDYLDGAVPSSFSIYGFWSDYNISVGRGTLYLRDIVFGAKSPSIQNDTRSFNVWAGGDAEVYSGGIYFLGNTSLTAGNLPKATTKGITVTNALGLLNSQFYIGSATGSASQALRVGFNTYFSNNSDGAGNTNKNFDTNCIHILDDNGNYGLVANRSATNGTRGAAVSGVIGNLSFGSTIITGGYQSWFTAFTNTNKHHGIAGAFGNYSYAIASLTDQPCVGLVIQEGLKITREPSYNNSLWQMATSGALLTSNVTLTSAPGGTQVSYDFAYNNAANLKISAFYKGIDVNSGIQILGSLPSNRFFG